MRVGILDILCTPAPNFREKIYDLVLAKQYASITPQAVSVWCKRLGHETFYSTYYGIGDPGRCLPSDLDVVFFSTYTQASPLAYALSKLYRRWGARTVIGGPHAKAFPVDCLRFFDLVVKDCDSQLVDDILQDRFELGTVVSATGSFEVPSVQERMPEIRKSAFFWSRRRGFMTTVPLLASVGCPYTCDFCIDWNSRYRLLSTERLAEDVQFLSRAFPGLLMAFHDPNFGIRFDEVMTVLETVPEASRNPYIMESSLSVLRDSRMERLRTTNCVAIAPGIESWVDYSNKAAVGQRTGLGKVLDVSDHVRRLHAQIPYLQVNFVLGLDSDEGDEPFDLTADFMTRTPFAWPALNIPVPFGGTPLYESLRSEDRILEAMPFAFYYAPYLVSKLKNYDPISYYRRLIDLFEHACSRKMLAARMETAKSAGVKAIHWTRTDSCRASLKSFRMILDRLTSDHSFRLFHEHRSKVLPDFYHRIYDRMLGRYGELLSRRDRHPVLDQYRELPHSPLAEPTAAATMLV